MSKKLYKDMTWKERKTNIRKALEACQIEESCKSLPPADKEDYCTVSWTEKGALGITDFNVICGHPLPCPKHAPTEDKEEVCKECGLPKGTKEGTYCVTCRRINGGA